MPADKIVGETMEQYEARTASHLTQMEQDLARAIDFSQEHYIQLAGLGTITVMDCIVAGQAISQIATRFAAMLPEAKWEAFLLASGCNQKMLSQAIDTVRGSVVSERVFGTTDPRKMAEMAAKDPHGMREKVQEVEKELRDPNIAATTSFAVPPKHTRQ